MIEHEPRRDEIRLTEPELLTRPGEPAAPTRKRVDAVLWLPAFGLMLVGVVAVAVNTFTLAGIARDPDGYERVMKAQAEDLARKMGQDPQAVANNPLSRWQTHAALSGWGLVCGVVSFLGGLGIVLRRWRRLAQLGCVTAALNLAGFCCVPGAVFGLWGLLMLLSEEGREHFS